jgi:glycosyltransferase involved in cell wall biosynthesis
MDKKISVVIPTYRRPALLLKCLHALKHQSFDKADFEIIIVSDGPDTDTEKMVREFSVSNLPRTILYPLPKKKGPAGSRNAGWKQAQGSLIAFTDDDCIPHSDWLTSLWEAYQAAGENEISFTGRTIVPLPTVPTDYELNISHLEKAEFITANCACTKEALQKVGGFDEQFTMAWREDSDLQFKLIEHEIPIVPVSNAVVTHPVRKAFWGVSLKEERKGMFNALLYKKYPDLYRRKIQSNAPSLYYSILGFFTLFLIGLTFQSSWLSITGLSGWIILTSWFINKRLRLTSHTVTHISEMVFTSFIIPFLSLYWRWYGALKYKVLLI